MNLTSEFIENHNIRAIFFRYGVLITIGNSVIKFFKPLPLLKQIYKTKTAFTKRDLVERIELSINKINVAL